MKNRTELLKYFASLKFTKGAEIGVAEGIFSKRMLDFIPNLNLLCIDPWTVGNRPNAYQMALIALKPYTNATILKTHSLDIVESILDEWLDFVYIDANHDYESVFSDITHWSKKVRQGGIVSGHDYYTAKSGNRGVIYAVNDYVTQNGYTLQLTNWNRRDPIRDERQPSWYFIKTK